MINNKAKTVFSEFLMGNNIKIVSTDTDLYQKDKWNTSYCADSFQYMKLPFCPSVTLK